MEITDCALKTETRCIMPVYRAEPVSRIGMVFEMKIFIHQRKLVAENLSKHLTNNKKKKKQSVHDNTKVSMQITNFYTAGQIYRTSSLKDHLAMGTLKTYNSHI